MSPASAQTTIIGTVKDASGTALTSGTIIFALSQEGTVSDPALLVVQPVVTCTITNGVIGTCSLRGNDQISPAGTFYRVRIISTGGRTFLPERTYTITGATWDIGTATPLASDTVTATAYQIVQDEGANLTQRQKLNFTGSGVNCVDNSTDARTDCTISGGGGGGSTHQIDGVNLTTQDPVNFQDTAEIDFTNPAAGNVQAALKAASIADSKLASNYSGVGSCAASNFVTSVNDNAVPTCAQPGFSDLSGSATDAQVPDSITLTNITQITNRAITDLSGTTGRSQLPAQVVYDDEANTYGAFKQDFGAATVEVPNATTLPGTCTVGEVFHDTDAAVGARFYLCTALNTWTAFDNPFGTAIDDGELASNYGGVGACGANQFETGDNDDAAPTCVQPNFSNLSGTASDAQVDGSLEADELVLAGDVDGTANANDLDELAVEAELEAVLDLPDLQGILDVSSGGAGAAPGADDQVLVSDSTSAATWRGVPDCNSNNMLTYTIATNTFGCDADDGAGGGAPIGVQYVVGASDATLTAEKILTDGTGIDTVLSGGDAGAATINLNFSDTLAGNPTFAAKECVFTIEGTSGGGFLCEGNVGGNTNEQLYLFPAVDGADTTTFIALGASDGDALAGDTATAFFDTGTLEDARLSSAVALSSDNLGFFAATTVAQLAIVLSDEDFTPGSETSAEGVLDLPDLQGQISDAQIADGAVDGGSGGEIADGSIVSADLATANKTFVQPVVLFDSTGLLDTDDIPSVFRAPAAITLKEVWCETDAGTPSVNFQRDDGTPANVLSSNLTPTVGGATGTIDTGEDNFAADERLDFVMVSASTAKRISCMVKFEVD